MNIGILGQPCIDEIILPNGEMGSRTPGGILYSFAAIDRAIRERGAPDRWVAMTWHSLPDADFLAPLYDAFTNMDRVSGKWPTSALTNRVRLVYHDEASRSENCPSILPALTPVELVTLDLESFDAIFVNMISGFDLGLETMEWLRSQTSAHIHLDIHALVLGDLSSDLGTSRSARGVTDWRRWLVAADSVQMNEMEAGVLALPEVLDESQLLTEATRLFKTAGRPRTLVITRAERGASSFDLATGIQTDVTPKPKTVVNTTGSGDVFGAMYTYARAQGLPDPESLVRAERWAGWNTTLPSLGDILEAPLV